MDAGKTRDLQMALWDAVMANRAAPARPGADVDNDDTASPQPKGGRPAVLLPHPEVGVPISARSAVPVGGYSVNLSAAAVAASHEPLPRMRPLQPSAANDSKAEPKPTTSASASAARAYVERVELSTEDGILTVAQVTPKAPGGIPGEASTLTPPLPAMTPGEVRLPRGAFPMADEGARAGTPAPSSPTPSAMAVPERLEARAYNDPAFAMNTAPRAPGSPELTQGTSAAPPAPPEMHVRSDAPPAHMTPAAFTAAAQLAAAEEAKTASRLLPRPAGELMHQLLASQDSPAATPELYRLIVGAAALGALLLLVL
jgi:hypothetical protein